MAALDVIIIGGGLAGACLANGLLNKAKDVVNVAVYERDERDSQRHGYQIRLGSYALAGFRACLTERQYTDLLLCFGRSGGVVSSAPAIFDPDLRLVLDLSKFPAYHKSAPIGRARLRNFLQAPLLEHAVLHHGRTFTHYEVLGPEAGPGSKIRAHFHNGSSADCDILISAEGSGSRINKQVGCNNITETSAMGNGGILGKCDLSWPVLRDLPRQLLEKGTIYTGCPSNKLFAAVYLPDSLTSPQQKASRLAGWKEEGKPSDYDEAHASLFVAFCWEGGLQPREALKLPDPKGYLRQQMAEAKWHPDFLKLIDALEPDALQTVPLREATDTPVDWRQKTRARAAAAADAALAHPRVWLLGDAIHPMLPTRGMGANNALRDAADALGPLLALARQKAARGCVTDADAQAQLAVYETAMIPRAMGWVKTSGQQTLPDLQSVQGKIMVFGVRLLLVVVGVVMQIATKLGWKPKDEAPELP